MNKKISTRLLLLTAVICFLCISTSQASYIEYIEGDIRISPSNNVFDKSAPRDLTFVVHHPETMLESIIHDGQNIVYSIYVFDGLRTDGQDLLLPYTSKIDIAEDFLESLGLGEHSFQFNFEDGTVRDFTLLVVDDATKGEFDLEIISFNVEHGTSVFIIIGETHILVDTGPNYMTKEYVVPYLKEMGVETIDYVFLTHWHWDHVSGLASVDRNLDIDDFTSEARDWMDPDNKIDGFEVGEIWYNLTDGETTGFDEVAGELASGQTHTDIFKVGNEFEIAGADFLVLNAARFDADQYPYYQNQHFGGYDNRNNRSLSFRMEYNGFVYTHGGDIYQHAQQAILNTFGEELVKAHFYHGNHHFHGGLSTEYLKKTDPYLFFTSAQQAAYNRTAYVDGVMGDVVPYLEAHSERFIENLFSFEVGHVILEANSSDDWRYKTDYISRVSTKSPLRLEIYEPEDETEFDHNEDINIKVDVTDPANSLDRLQFYASRELLTEISEPPYEYTWKQPPEGRYLLRVDGIDAGDNIIASTDIVEITVGDVTLPDTLVHHWAFDEQSGNIAYNSVNLNDGIVHGATWTDGKYGNALEFNGISDYVEIPHHSSLNFEKDVTIAAWIYLNDASGGQNVLQKGRNYALFELREGNNYPANVFHDGNEWRIFNYTIEKEYFEDAWHHVAFTYDGNVVANYINGEPDHSFNISGSMSINTENLGIGVNSPYNDSYFNGRIDEVVIFNIALEPSQIELVYQNKLDEISQVTGLATNAELPLEIALMQNYPNPFNPVTTIQFTMPSMSNVTLRVFDILGREVAVLIDEEKPAGYHEVHFDASHMPSGIYMYRLETPHNQLTRRMTLIK